MVGQAAMALEIAEDRRHCSIVTAGRLRDGLVLLDLAAYLGAPSPPPCSAARAADGHRGGGRPPLPCGDRDPAARAADVKVARPTSGDIAEAHGLFLDELAAGRIRHLGQLELSAAMRYLEHRRLGGASAPERRGALVDVSPAVAAELAVWALLTSPADYDVMMTV